VTPARSLDDTFAALADPVRRGAVELLAQRPRRAGELAAELGTTPATMSKHLRVLRQGGLVDETQPEFDARVRIYSLRSGPMVELRGWLDRAERGWAAQLASFAEHVERSG
jgi:DNA-binding transcriptional ArsR family regulator